MSSIRSNPSKSKISTKSLLQSSSNSHKKTVTSSLHLHSLNHSNAAAATAEQQSPTTQKQQLYHNDDTHQNDHILNSKQQQYEKDTTIYNHTHTSNLYTNI